MSDPLGSCRSHGTDKRGRLLGAFGGSYRNIVGCTRLRRIKSKGAVLTILQQYFVCTFFFTILWMLTEIQYEKYTTELLAGAAAFLFLAISCPVAGWLADVYFGRYKVMRFGLWLMWIISIYAIVSLLLLDKFDPRDREKKFNIVEVPISLLIPIGFASFVVNAVQFGVDQIPEGSAEELSTLIHWFAWATFAGELTARITHLLKFCIPSFIDRSFLSAAVQFMVPATMLTLALCCDFLFRGWLINEPEKQNPVKTIVRVIKFAATHRHPVRHRAITYCAKKMPSRIDIAKEKYGGPYTTEQVEDVKTCFRITVVIASTSAFMVTLILYLTAMMDLVARSTGDHCSPISMEVFYCVSTVAIVVIPLYEFVLHPLIRNRVPNMLMRVGIAAVLTVILSGTLLTVDSVKHALNPDIGCMFQGGSAVVKLDLWLQIPSSFLTAIEMVLYSTAIAEFTYAQSPYNMRGLLIGLLFSTVFITFPVALGIFIAWSGFKKQIPPSCDFYYFLFQFLCAVVGLFVLCIVARRYKWRRREEEEVDQRRIYDRLLNNQSESQEDQLENY